MNTLYSNIYARLLTNREVSSAEPKEHISTVVGPFSSILLFIAQKLSRFSVQILASVHSIAAAYQQSTNQQTDKQTTNLRQSQKVLCCHKRCGRRLHSPSTSVATPKGTRRSVRISVELYLRTYIGMWCSHMLKSVIDARIVRWWRL